MKYEINGFKLQKAGDGENGALLVKAFSNALVLDRQNQRIADRAFSEPTVARFLNIGVFDYWHESASNSLNKTERAEKMLGAPDRFTWEDYGGVRMPVTYGKITMDHPIVKQIRLVEHLNAGVDAFAVSVGGQVLNKAAGDNEEIITDIYWDHLAIAPKNRVICPGSRLMLQKAENGEPCTVAAFEDLTRFCIDMVHVPEDSEYLHKALTVGGGSLDIRDLTGVNALMPRELEEDIRRFHILNKAGIITGNESVRYWFNGNADAVIDAVHKQQFSEGGR